MCTISTKPYTDLLCYVNWPKFTVKFYIFNKSLKGCKKTVTLFLDIYMYNNVLIDPEFTNFYSLQEKLKLGVKVEHGDIEILIKGS